MYLHRRNLCALALAAALPLAGRAQATFPNRTVRLINPFPAGSGPDVVSRLVGSKISTAWSQPVVVDNKPGASGFIALSAAAASAPAGYDLVVADVGHMAINTSLFRKLPYDPVKTFVPVAGLYRTAFFVLVGAQSPIKTVAQLIAAAKVAPDKVSYGSNSVGSPLHLGAAQLESLSGTHMLHVPFKEASQLYQAVAAGDVDWSLGSIGSAGPLIKAGKLRVLAVADRQRSPAMPDVPTITEAGGPAGVDGSTWVGLFAPAGTPAAAVTSIHHAVKAALEAPDVRDKMAIMDFTPSPATPDEVAQWIRDDTRRYGALVKLTGASVD